MTRHVRTSHPELQHIKWHAHVTKVDEIAPTITNIKRKGDDIIVTISWGNSKKKCYSMGTMIGSPSIQAQLKELQDNPSSLLHQIANSEKMKQMLDLVLKTKQQCGKFGAKIDQCAICHETAPSYNKSVMFHKDQPELQGHIFCTNCIMTWLETENNHGCPVCRGPGVPLRIYHKK